MVNPTGPAPTISATAFISSPPFHVTTSRLALQFSKTNRGYYTNTHVAPHGPGRCGADTNSPRMPRRHAGGGPVPSIGKGAGGINIGSIAVTGFSQKRPQIF